jgi:hypothetical protein
MLLLLVFGIIDFGRAFFFLNALNSAARHGARFAATQPNPDDDAAVAAYIASGYDASLGALGGQPTGAASISASVTFAPPPAPAGTPEYVTVIIDDYPFQWLTPLPGLAGLAPDGFGAISATFRWERAP